MIEVAQEALGSQDFWDARSAILATDAGAIRARRHLMQLRRSSAEGGPTSGLIDVNMVAMDAGNLPHTVF
ncbi:hypothetical protein [Polymorphobacter sp. PAMC 29334]|uniref:hypothetical protein n=1 Tax=Polymorphobacter sp. PAMC 29334 TaxID=2862331 RepID=UPI001CA4F3DD|nr:hypothetical protein [Polymorphobacter sp. PAMC 29334]